MRFLLDDFEKIVCAVIFIVMTVLGFANVVVRYLTSYSFASTQEVLLNGFLLMTVFGAAIAARRGEHLAVTLLSDILPEGARKAVILFATALSVGLLVLSAWYSADLLFNQYVSGVTSPGRIRVVHRRWGDGRRGMPHPTRQAKVFLAVRTPDRPTMGNISPALRARRQ